MKTKSLFCQEILKWSPVKVISKSVNHPNTVITTATILIKQNSANKFWDRSPKDNLRTIFERGHQTNIYVHLFQNLMSRFQEKEFLGWLVVLGFNATLTAKVISWRSVTHNVFPGFLTPVLTQLFFPKPLTTFPTCFCKGERQKYARKESRLNRGSNSQPPGHESEPPGRGEEFLRISSCPYTACGIPIHQSHVS